jgi:glycerophosphoryl diester phosphodiesterase
MAAVRPIVIAHRGASGYLPEHTLAAYFLAAELGADYIEPDLVMTRDRVLVARHENEISSTTDVASRPEFADRRATKTIDGVAISGWFTEDFELEELRQLRTRERLPTLRPANARFDGRFPIPTFEEILELAAAVDRMRAAAARLSGRPVPQRLGVYPETKHPSYFAGIGRPMEGALVETLVRHGFGPAARPAFIQSFEVANLEALRTLTDIPLVQLIESEGRPFDFSVAGRATTYAELLTPAGLARIATYADAIGVPKSAVLHWNAARPHPTALVGDAHAAGLAVHVWTFRAENVFLPEALRSDSDPARRGDLASELNAALAAGIDGFFIDQTDLGADAVAASRA